MSVTEPHQPDKTLAELVSDMTTDVSTLMRKEIELAKEELRVEADKAGKVGANFGAAAVIGLLAAIALVMTLGFLLGEVVPVWVGFLIVTVVLAAVAAVLAVQGRKKLQEINPVPEQTVETLKEDAQWLSEQRN